MPPLKLNEYVRIQVNKIWEPAKVIEIHNDRSYTVQTESGGIYRRNRVMLNKTMENFPQIQDFTPKVFADSSQHSPVVHPNERIKEPLTQPVPNMPSSNDPPYITRSGREVKKNRRYYSENFTNK